MAQDQKKSHDVPTAKPAVFTFDAADFAATAKKGVEQFTNAQSELFNTLQNANRNWLARIQAEGNLASELASKLAAARSVPDALTACQQWGSRRIEMMAEDAKHLFDDTQKLMQTSTRLWPNGSHSQGASPST